MQTKNLRINYSVSGEGKALVLLHGWGGSSKSLEGLQELLAADGFKVYNIDLPGFGTSETPEQPMNLADYVESLRIVFAELKLEKPVIVGHSFGGKVAIAYTAKYQDKVAALVLVNSSGINPKNELKKSAYLLPSKIFGKLFELPLLNIIKPLVRKLYYKLIVGETDYLQAGAMQETLKLVVNEHLDSEISTLKLPTLIIWGEQDTYTPLWQGKEMSRLMPSARFEVVQGATHGLPLKQPEVVADLILRYITK